MSSYQSKYLALFLLVAAAGCGSSASDAVDAGTASGGSSGAAGGAPGAGSGGASSSTGGATGTGGASSSTGGNTGAGGTSGTGGQAGARGTGGAAATGGAPGTGGAAGTGGAPGAVPLDPTLLSRCTGTNPIRCTIPVAANGDYTVTVELGDPAAASSSRVQAELLRVVVPTLSLAAGQLSQQTFSVNVRAEVHDGYSAPGMILDLLDRRHRARACTASASPRVPNLPTIFVAGDSTVCDWDPAAANILSPIQRGWAQESLAVLRPRHRRRQLRRLG